MARATIIRDYSVLPPRQRQVLDAYLELLLKEGVPPSIRELQLVTGIGSPNGMKQHLDALALKGWLNAAEEYHVLRWRPGPRLIAQQRRVLLFLTSDGRHHVDLRTLTPRAKLTPAEALALARELELAARECLAEMVR